MTQEEKAKEIVHEVMCNLGQINQDLGVEINDDFTIGYNSALRMAEWQKQQMIEKAVEWLKENAHYYVWRSELDVACGICDEFVNDFKKAMEGEQ